MAMVDRDVSGGFGEWGGRGEEKKKGEERSARLFCLVEISISTLPLPNA